MATLLKGKYLENNSISNAKLVQITEMNKVAGSAVELNTISGALINISGLKIAVDNSTVVISNNKLQIGPDLSQFIKNDGSVPMTGNLILDNHRISGVLSGHLSGDAVTYEQLMNTITQISGAGASNLDGLSDVIISSAATNQVLKFDGSNWINSSISTGGASNLDGLSDVLISSPVSGQVLKFDGSNWINSTVSGGSVTALSDLTDVIISNAVISKETGEGNILVYTDGSWQNRDNMLFGKTFSFHLPAKPTITSRALSAFNVPSGWTILTAAQDTTAMHRLGTTSANLLISHNVGTFVYDIKVLEIDTTGPFNTRYCNIKDYNGEDEIRNSLSDAGSGDNGKPSCVRIQDLAGNLQVANEAIIIVRFL